MNDPYTHGEAGEAGEATEALGQRMDAVRELIGQLTISSVATDESAAQPPSPENFRLLCERLRRLLDQSGMADCARAALSLEQAVKACPLRRAWAPSMRCWHTSAPARSEERRVGKECRWRGGRYQ